MNNYKIKVNNESESREAQELFFELGYEWNGSGKEVVSWRLGLLFTKDFQGKNCLCYFDKDEDVMLDGWVGKELTLPELRDLVVLHRNDIQDANWVTEGDDQIYQDSNGKSFIFREQGWDELQSYEMRQAMWKKVKPKPQAVEPEQGLISGADALRALADGDYVEYWCEDLEQWVFMDMQNHFKRKFRIKPRTITLNVEIPAPFEPKEFEDCYMLTDLYEHGYTMTSWKYCKQVPAWRTEEEIKQVVAALRGGIKG